MSEAPDVSTPPPMVLTGVSGVDAVLATVDAVDHLPLEEQLGVFERAHDDLRRALDAPPGSVPAALIPSDLTTSSDTAITESPA